MGGLEQSEEPPQEGIETLAVTFTLPSLKFDSLDRVSSLYASALGEPPQATAKGRLAYPKNISWAWVVASLPADAD